jgi:hypothetical protein
MWDTAENDQIFEEIYCAEGGGAVAIPVLMIGAGDGERLMSRTWLAANITSALPVAVYIPQFAPFDALHCEILPQRLLEYTWYLFSAGLLFCCGLAACQVWRSLVFCRRWQRRRNGLDADAENPLRRGLLSRVGVRERQAAIAALPTRAFDLASASAASAAAGGGCFAAARPAAPTAEAAPALLVRSDSAVDIVAVAAVAAAEDASARAAASGSGSVATTDDDAELSDANDAELSEARDAEEGDTSEVEDGVATLDFFSAGAVDDAPHSAPAATTACGAMHESGQVECVICIEDFIDGETLRVLPCNHCFHVACVDVWLLERPLCPLCKAPALPAGVSGEMEDTGTP